MFNNEAECKIISILLESGQDQKKQSLIDEVCEDDFYQPPHKRVFRALAEVIKSGQYVDTLSVAQYMLERNMELHSYEWLQELGSVHVQYGQALTYCRNIKELSFKRGIVRRAEELTEAVNSGVEVGELSQMLEQVGMLSAENTSACFGGFIGEGMGDYIDTMESRSKQRSDVIGLSSGFQEIDKRTFGFMPGWLVIVAGRPSHGKTFFTQQMAEYSSIDLNLPTLFFSMEMDQGELTERAIANQSGINKSSLKTGNLSDEEWGKLTNSFGRVADSKLIVDPTSRLSAQQIKARARYWKKRCPDLCAIYVDYLGMMKKPKADRNDIAVGENAAALKALAKELKVPVILLVQANRAADQVSRPTMSNIKDSSDIEATADLILFVHRDEVGNPESQFKGITEIIGAKDRHNDFNDSVYLTLNHGKLVGVSPAEMGRIELANSQPKSNSKGM